jgi:Flp pilus assembly pilin Flp
MPTVHVKDPSGQAAAEYTALLALVTVVLGGAGAVVGIDEIGEAVAGSIRTGVCIVGGDICRASDAAAAGLDPCTLDERSRGGGTTLTVASLRVGGHDGWTVAARSDGTVLVTQTGRRSAGGAVGLGVSASPLGLRFGIEGKYDFTTGSGRAWELPDAAAAARLIAADDGDRPPPTWRFGEAGSVLAGEAAAKVGGATLTGIEATATAAAGARIGRGETTIYVRARLDSGASVWVPGDERRVRGPSTGDVIAEITRDADGLREIAFRTAERGGGAGRIVETVARLDLRDPANRGAAEPLLSHRLPWPPGVLADLRAVARRAVRYGVVERAVYAVRDASDELEVSARVGLAVGIDVDRVEIDRRLVAASAWTPGSRERSREDCVR